MPAAASLSLSRPSFVCSASRLVLIVLQPARADRYLFCFSLVGVWPRYGGPPAAVRPPSSLRRAIWRTKHYVLPPPGSVYFLPFHTNNSPTPVSRPPPACLPSVKYAVVFRQLTDLATRNFEKRPGPQALHQRRVGAVPNVLVDEILSHPVPVERHESPVVDEVLQQIDRNYYREGRSRGVSQTRRHAEGRAGRSQWRGSRRTKTKRGGRNMEEEGISWSRYCHTRRGAGANQAWSI